MLEAQCWAKTIVLLFVRRTLFLRTCRYWHISFIETKNVYVWKSFFATYECSESPLSEYTSNVSNKIIYIYTWLTILQANSQQRANNRYIDFYTRHLRKIILYQVESQRSLKRILCSIIKHFKWIIASLIIIDIQHYVHRNKWNRR